MKHLLTAAAFALLTTPAQAQDKLSIMLDWFVNPDHGPIIVAQSRGYFAEAGLEVDIIAPADPSDPPKMAAAGKVDLAVGYQPQLYLQHAAGLSLMRVGTLISSPLYCVMVDAGGPVQTLADLKGRRVGYSVPGLEEALMHTMLRANGVDPANVEQINVNFALTSALAAGQVDAVSGAFRNFELSQMTAIGKTGRCFLPEEHGVPVYDELIYLTNPETVDADKIARFLAATKRATTEIMADPEAGWQTFRAYSAELDDTLNAAAWQATAPLFATDPGTLDIQRYAAFGAYMADIGMIAKAPEVSTIATTLGAQ
ncbi:ABC transporter substrate-binding protein [Thalassovita taeanensis]|uniref:Putative hydroxymethylpyrimidine transport system substrate-binding protein n=1 Tax=Thalassovita taeanensis TaxID=657014 RepID=A0A1H8ZDW1_9RHOB|nr:ABC transporter substrate-binding protein [Thalassovita taeanensis]SEP62594.1 putative hydroxymethylpyrimidine transport system substrate-binding protein [Thalassovita taeanensis]